jgi:two-component system sensor histidine kinase KdpD
MQTEQMRSGLLSAVSHDLRTPLAAITGAASTLRDNADRLPAETRAELVESIAEEAERLGRLVNNLLDMTRFEAGGVALQRDLYPLEEIVGSALQRLESQLEGREVRVVIPEDLPLVSADDVLLGQVLWNLLENAIKYTPPGSSIDIVATQQPGAVVLDVADRGPGIPPGDEEQIFEKFYRGEKSRGNASSSRGAGLGLPICRAILEAHGGTIAAHPREGGGALFRMTLPSSTWPQ